MSLNFNPPEWLIREYMNRKQPAEIASEGIGQALNTYVQYDQNKQRNALVQSQIDQKNKELAMKEKEMAVKGKEQFFEYGDPTSLPQDVQQQMTNPVQGPANELGVGPSKSPIINYFQDFMGLKSTERNRNVALQESEINKNNAMAEAYRKKGTGVVQEKAPAGYRWTASGDLEVIPNGPADNKISKENEKISTVFDLYETARDGLTSAMEKTSTGPILGRLPAITANQQTADASVAAMAPVLKQLFRVAGEGVFTDRDQALLLDMVTKRTEHPEARKEIMQNMDNIIRAKLGMGKMAAGDKIPTVTDQSAYNALPSGSEYIGADGRKRRKK